MQNNTVQTLIDYVKDLTGQTNASTAKIIRALNFGVDHYSYLRVTSSGKWRWDSSNQTDLPRVTGTLTSGGKVSLESELIALEHVEILIDGQYQTVHPTDQRNSNNPLGTVYGSGQPLYYDYDSHYLYFYPVPSTSYTVRLTYSRAHPRYATDNLTQSTGVNPVHEEYIALYAADRLMIGKNDPSRTQIRQELQVKEQEIRDLASKQDMDTGRRLKPIVPNVFSRKSRGKRGSTSSGISGVNY